MAQTIRLTLFYCQRHLGAPQFQALEFDDLAEARRCAANHVGDMPITGGSGLSDLYAYSLGNAQSLRAKGVTAAQLFPRLAFKEAAE